MVLAFRPSERDAAHSPQRAPGVEEGWSEASAQARPRKAKGMDLSKASTLHLLECRVTQHSPATILIYEMVERRFVQWLNDREIPPSLSALSSANARAFLQYIQTEHVSYRQGKPLHHGPKSLQQHAQCLKAWAAYLEREGLFPRGNPLATLKLPRIPNKEVPRFSREQVELLVTCAGRTRHPLRNKAILLLLAETGLRASELCALKLSDLSLSTTKHQGRARVMGKGQKERLVYFGTRCSQQIQRYLAGERRWERGGDPGSLFLSSRGGPLQRGLLDQLIKEVGKLALIQDVRLSAHTLRHTFAVEYLRRNPGQVFQLQQLLGHSSLEITQHYARLAQQDVEHAWTSWVDG